MKIIVEKKIKKTKKKKKYIAIIKNYITIRIAGKVSRYIDASMNRATPRNRYIKHIPVWVWPFPYIAVYKEK